MEGGLKEVLGGGMIVMRGWRGECEVIEGMWG